MQRLCEIEQDLLTVFDQISIAHEIIAFEVECKCEYQYIDNYKFYIPLPGLRVNLNIENFNLLNEILSKKFICNLNAHFSIRDSYTTPRLSLQEFTVLLENLKINHTSQEINLSKNGLGDEGAMMVAESLKFNSVIKKN